MSNFKKLRQMFEVKGNGNIVSKETKVSSFIRLHLSGRGIIELYQADEEKVVIETDENLQEFFDITNSGRTLYVSSDAKLKRPVYTKSVIKVYIRQMDTLYIRNESADVVCPDRLNLANPLEIKIQSVGNTELDIAAPAIKLLSQCQGNVVLKGKCDSITIKNQSQGNLDTAQLEANELTIKNMAEGNIDLFANQSISISHYGQGYIHYAGNAILKDIKQYGDGEVVHV